VLFNCQTDAIGQIFQSIARPLGFDYRRFAMKPAPAPGNPIVLSYLELRTVVGIVGIALPFVLALGMVVQGFHGLESSLSSYYYTDLRNVFVGSLCVIAAFLASCRGYDRRDEIAGWLAGACAIGVAFFPTTPDGCATPEEKIIGDIHYTFAGILFLTLAYFCLFLFTLTHPDGKPTAQKLKRNTVYVVCGWIMLACIALMLLFIVPVISNLVHCSSRTFWLESTAIVAFGVAWLTKGEAILKDKSAGPPRPQ
jgi:hypothetical protein